MSARKKPNPSLVVQTKDCYDPADYILVHKDRYADLVKYQQWWKDACDVTDKVRNERDAALVTLREYVMQSEALMKLPFGRVDELERAMKVMVITPSLYDSLKSMGYDMSIYHRDELIPVGSPSAA